jgi:hypothetical protein
MPSHDRLGLDEHESGAPAPPRLGQDDPEQPIASPELRPGACAPHRVELLAKGEVLKHQFVMSAAGQRQGADEDDNQLQHALIVSFSHRRSKRDCAPVRILAKDRRMRLLRIIVSAGVGVRCGAV